ncbi:MAG: hypothetical protein GYB55_00060 [Cytophagales bacterium]|uniref:hypothetical protein n=1 Tax=Cyclobacterium marinum TaxID=104 RepID=UPI0030DB4128|nr:hypothetical protein [Cytophagales bacterium]|tara:strand:- start:66838 stop:67599 length:762 start_codon:yes stop_codon:yes gene_type:complete
MPVERFSDTSPRFFEPEETVELARYVDITKFLSLLKDEQLFFCRLDNQEDKFEGTFPKISKKEFGDFYRNLSDTGFFNNPMTEEEIEKEINEDFEFRKKLKALYCVNCWNEFKGESYALWKIYSDLNQGIMIKSSFKRIINALKESKEKVYCSKVKYIDYDTDSIDIGNTMSPVVHKHKAYSYENEIRLIHEVSNIGWENEKYKNGIKVNVNLVKLIDEIVISPFAPEWFSDLIRDILDKYSLNFKLIDSKLK